MLLNRCIFIYFLIGSQFVGKTFVFDRISSTYDGSNLIQSNSLIFTFCFFLFGRKTDRKKYQKYKSKWFTDECWESQANLCKKKPFSTHKKLPTFSWGLSFRKVIVKSYGLKSHIYSHHPTWYELMDTKKSFTICQLFLSVWKQFVNC